MRMARSTTWVLSGMVVVLCMTGCENPDRQQVAALQEQVYDLQRENEDLRGRLARAQSDRDAAMQRAGALAQENTDLRLELARAKSAERQLPENWQRGPAGSVFTSLGTDLLFDSGKASLKAAGKAQLQAVVNQINESFPDALIWVVGHTDAEPISVTKNLYKDNLALSLARGATVYRELAALGIAPRNMIAGGQGEHNPIAPNDAKGRSKVNRRVQIFALPGAAAATEAGLRPARVGEPVEATPPQTPQDMIK